MRFRQIFRLIAILNFFLGLSMLVPLCASLIFSDGSFAPLLYSILITSGSGLIVFLLTKTSESSSLSQREGMAVVTFSWVSTGFFGALPFLLSGSIGTLTNAYFESISGFTTTGACCSGGV